ncbi:hypothetical protein [Streptomyces sp. bgisy100]|uniref:hypothetical protein n=1 Tax=Streptomyces sp. bgisy100 TaxID=3413783 RepID=UPI003D7077EA
MRTHVSDEEAPEGFQPDASAHVTDPVPTYFRELFLGEYGESPVQRAARTAVAREVLAELQEEGETDEVARQNALYAQQLSEIAPLWRNAEVPAAAEGEAA